MGYSRGTWRTKLSKYVINKMNLIKHNNLVLVFTILFISSCQTNQVDIIEPEVDEITLSEDKIFEEYLAAQWIKDLEDNPIFAYS